MPMYEYKCKKCQKIEEILQGYDEPAPQCEKCKEAMTRMISRTSFSLKGGGWFKDGYQKTGKKEN